MHLIYEGNKYEFDIPKGKTINYIKDLAQKIYHLDDKELNIMYNDQNLSNYNNNVLLSSIIPKGENTITIHLERKDAIGKNLINSSNVSTSDTNVNDKQYKSMRNKFMKINLSYNKITEKISNFNSLLETAINKIIKNIREFEEKVIKLNETLKLFYNNKSFNRLNEAFDENQQSNNLSDKDLKSLNNEIESFIINYKFLITQHNFQDNILDFINQINDKFKFGKIKFAKLKNEDNYENIVLSLDKIFTELLFVNAKNNNYNDIENNKSNYLKTEINYKNNKKKRLFNDFPRIDSNSKDKSTNHFYTQSDKSYYSKSNLKGNILKLKKNNLNSSHKNLSLPTFKLNQSKSNFTSTNSPNKLYSRNFLPGLNNIKSYQTKTLDSVKNNNLSKTQSKIQKDMNINKNNPIKNLLYNSLKNPIKTAIKKINNNNLGKNNSNNNLKNNNSNNNLKNNNSNNNLKHYNSKNNINDNNKNNINKNDDDEYNEKEKEYNSRNRKNTVISNRFNQSMNIDVKPKIMDRDLKKKISRNSNTNEFTPNNKTVNTIEDKIDNGSKFDIMSLKPMKKFQTKIPPLFDYSSSKEHLQESKNYLKTDREKKDDISIPKIISAAIKKITQSKTNNNSNNISHNFEKQNTLDSKDNKTKFKVIKNNDKNIKTLDKNKNDSSDSDSEINMNNHKKSLREENNNLKETKTNINSTKINFTNNKKKEKANFLLTQNTIKTIQNNIKKNESQNRKNKFHTHKSKIIFGDNVSFFESKDPKMNKTKTNESSKSNKFLDNKDEINDEKNITTNNFERKNASRKGTKKSIVKDFIDSDDEDFINQKKNNDKEQIEKLTKDLLTQGKDTKSKNFSKTHVDELLKTYEEIDKEKEKEKEKENEEEKEKDSSLNDNKNKKKKKEKKKKQKKKNINVYDFII